MLPADLGVGVGWKPTEEGAPTPATPASTANLWRDPEEAPLLHVNPEDPTQSWERGGRYFMGTNQRGQLILGTQMSHWPAHPMMGGL